MDYEAPFDVRFRDLMVGTTRRLMDCGFRTLFGYTESDEISVLLHPEDSTFQRKTRKLISIFAGEASAYFSANLGIAGVFDSRLSVMANEAQVIDYFRWRQEDAGRNALNSHCYWAIVKAVATPQAATERLRGMSVAAKNEFLFQEHQMNFNDLPNWQKRGVGVVWETYEAEGMNPLTGEKTACLRRKLETVDDLSRGEEYEGFLRSLMQGRLAE
jgi:tRNA(His) 5'-end guanylyltransferase